jgi:hypothetical protein
MSPAFHATFTTTIFSLLSRLDFQQHEATMVEGKRKKHHDKDKYYKRT